MDRGEPMKSENLITAAELNALLTTEEREQLGAKEAFVSDDDEISSAATNEETSEETAAALNQAVITRLQEAVSALTLRVEALEHQVEQQAAELEQHRRQQTAVMEAAAANASTALETVVPSTPEPGTFSRIESYGRNRKKKKSLLQKMLD
jgi:molecular chaperone GrpE (heat shock protein)